MPELNWIKDKDARPVAIARGGDYDGKVLYLHTTSNKSSTVKNTIENPVEYMKDLKHLKPVERIKIISELIDSVEKNKESKYDDPKLTKVLSKMKDDSNSHCINLPDDSMFQVIPNPDPKAREIHYVAGISGSGKSYYARNYAEAYKKIFPDREVYLISKYPVDEDDTLGKMKIGKPKSISLESLVSDYPSIEEFRECLIIFDDYDTLAPPYDKVVLKLIDDVAIRGRHEAVSMLVLSHYLTNYKKTRLILGEAHYIVLYPMATSFKAMKYVCEHHCGLTNDEIHNLKKLGRWIAIFKLFPQYLISQHKAYLLNH